MTTDPDARLRQAAAEARRVADAVAPEHDLGAITAGPSWTRRAAPLVAVAATAAAVVALVVTAVDLGPATGPTPEVADQPDGAPGDDPTEDPAEDPTEGPVDDPPEEPGGDPGADGGVVPREVGDCSASRLPAEVEPQPDLPDPVAQLRIRLADLATDCDDDGLAALTADDFTHSYGDDGDPVAYWRRVEEAGEEPPPLEALRRVLDAPPGELDPASASVDRHWVWPRLATLDPGRVAPDELDAAIDEVVATGVHDRDLVEQMVEQGGGYLGWRVHIVEPADGTAPRWTVLVAGD